MKVMAIIVLLGLSALALAAPLNERIEDDPELTAGYFEGDIVLRNNALRNGDANETLRWPNNTVTYKIHDGYFDEEQRNYILKAMKLIEDSTCVRFKEAAPEQKDYINITGEVGGCYADVGWMNMVQYYNLQVYPLEKGCFKMGSIVHELLHVLGFFHMQNTWNRDDYIRVVYEYIPLDVVDNFVKFEKDRINDYGVEYDYGSVMHYHAYAFSNVSTERTIIPLKEGVTIGQRDGMSASDILKVNLMYHCPINTK